MHGTWEPEPNGVFMLRTNCGVNMHWSSTKKTVWFDGPDAAQKQLAAKLARVEVLTLPEHPTVKLLER